MEVKQGSRHSKEEIKQMIKDNTLPRPLMEIFQEAKSWWFNNSKEVLLNNYHTIKAAEESGV